MLIFESFSVGTMPFKIFGKKSYSKAKTIIPNAYFNIFGMDAF
jgi:hypothetical protein